MPPELPMIQVISLAWTTIEPDALPAQDDLEQWIEPNHHQGLPQGMNRPPEPEVGRITEPEDIRRDRLIILDDINYILSGGSGIIDHLKGPLNHDRKRRQFEDGLEDVFN